MSSHGAVRRAARLFAAAKAGHGGTLDPLATGLLPVMFGEATKFSADLLEADKAYEAQLTLGVRTDSYDAEGQVIASAPVRVTADEVSAALNRFVGRIEQVPPMYSALKRDGQPLYALARRGIEVERAPRSVTIYRIDLLGFDAPLVRLAVHCSKGTYVRSLADDLGQALGCGAHLSGLRRTSVGALRVDAAHTLEALQALAEQRGALDHLLLPVDTLVERLPRIELDAEQARRFGHGQTLVLGIAGGAPQPRLRVYHSARFVGLASHDGAQTLRPLRLLDTGIS